MIVNEIFYGVKCNRCGQMFEDSDDHSFWMDEHTALEYAGYSDWIDMDKNKHYCPECYEIGDDDKEKIKDSYPKKVVKTKKFINNVVGFNSIIHEHPDFFLIKCNWTNRKLNIEEMNFIIYLSGCNMTDITQEVCGRTQYKLEIIIKK